MLFQYEEFFVGNDEGECVREMNEIDWLLCVICFAIDQIQISAPLHSIPNIDDPASLLLHIAFFSTVIDTFCSRSACVMCY